MKKRYISPKSRVIVADAIDLMHNASTEIYDENDGSWGDITGGDINFTDDDSYIFIRGTEINTTIQDTWK